MDFFARQASSRRRSRWLLLYFALALLLTLTAVNLIAFCAWQWLAAANHGVPFSSYQWRLWLANPWSWATTAAALALVLGGTLQRLSELRDGGPAVAQLMGGREVQRATLDGDERRLLNVVDEMAIAAGQMPPRVYIIDDEPALNAFVAGSNSHNMALTVTQGLLTHLNRDELQGVIGHEFSHIVHDDVILNTRLISYLAGILLISRLGRLLLRLSANYGSSNHRRGTMPLLIPLGLALWLAGWIGWLCGRILQAAVLRQREYLADASAVQFTRQTNGLAGALRKVLETPYGGRMSNARASEISHLCIADNLGSGSWFASHPPLEARIRALQPWFRMLRKDQDGRHQRSANMPSSSITAALAAGPKDQPAPPPAQHVRDEVERWGGAALSDPLAAGETLLGLVMAQQQQPAAAVSASHSDPENQRDLDLLRQQLVDLPQPLRLPLLELLIATARQQPESQRQQLSARLAAVIDSDGQRSLFDLLVLTLWQQEQTSAPPPATIRSYRDVDQELTIVLSLLAHASPGDASQRFALAACGFGLAADQPLPRAALTSLQLSTALGRLAAIHPLLKQPLYDACRETAWADQVLTTDENELLTLLRLILGLTESSSH